MSDYEACLFNGDGQIASSVRFQAADHATANSYAQVQWNCGAWGGSAGGYRVRDVGSNQWIDLRKVPGE